MFVLSIDVGITNLGYVFAEITFPDLVVKYRKTLLDQNKEYRTGTQDIRIISCNRVDITRVRHNLVQRCNCTLHHDNCIPDYLDHFIQEHPMFEQCDVLLIERQPPVGITNVQDLLFTRFRDKVLLISPNSVHKYFDLSSDYSDRKINSERIASTFLSGFNNFTENHRKHDISDALLMILYYYKLKVDEQINTTPLNQTIVHDFDQFRYIKPD